MTITLNKTRIRQIISRDVISVAPDTPVTEAVSIMAKAAISCLVVAEDKKPVGIFTERDLVKVATSQTAFADQSISRFMTSPVVTIPGNVSILDAYHAMLTNNIRHHVVVDSGGRILGVMSQSDMGKLLGVEYFLEMRKIEQIMTFNVVTVHRHLPLCEALSLMGNPGISCVVVTDGEFPAGIVTERDAVKLVAGGADLINTPVGAVMTSPVLTVPVGTTVHRAAVVMRQEKIRRVVVVDNEGKVEGIVTQSDIIKGLEGNYIRSLKEIVREKDDMLRQTSRELMAKTAYLDNILSSSIEMGIIATDSDFRIKYINSVAESLLDNHDIVNLNGPAAELQALQQVIPVKLHKTREIIRKKGKYIFTAELEGNGGTRFYDCSMTRILEKQKKLLGYVLILHDVTERRQHENTIRHLAYHDALTGLPNRVMLNDRLSQALALARRNDKRLALMILDLDRFKDVNDTLGHSVGDLLLKAVAHRLRELLRQSDTVSRMGGDEFVMLLPLVSSAESAAIIAGKIIRAFRKPFVCDGHTLKVTASIGIADFPDDGQDVETLLKNADIALYQVKEHGRNNFQRYHEQSPENAVNS